MVWPVAPRLQACMANYCTRQHKIKSQTRENDAFKGCSKHEMYEDAAGIIQHTDFLIIILFIYF